MREDVMTRVLLLALLLLSICDVTQSQAASRITLTGDAQGLECSISDVSPGYVEVHIWAHDADLLAIQFAAPAPDCWKGATWVADHVPVGIYIGNSQDYLGSGLSVAFGVCVESPVYVGSISFNVQGRGGNCCEFPVLKAQNDGYPGIEGPIVVTCADPNHVAAVTASAFVNPTAQCACTASVPADDTTWGQIKAMYQ